MNADHPVHPPGGYSYRSFFESTENLVKQKPLESPLRHHTSAPVVDKIDAGSVVSRLVRSTHYYTLNVCSEAACEHVSISFMACGIDSAAKSRYVLCDSQLLACAEKGAEMLFRSWAGTHCGK